MDTRGSHAKHDARVKELEQKIPSLKLDSKIRQINENYELKACTPK